jgi:hypothetical protein
MLARFLREPLLIFLAAGIAIFLLYWLVSGRHADPVVLAAGTRATLIAEFETLTGRVATPADIERIERQYVADELLFRAAVADGVHLSDVAVRSRLIEEMRQRATGVLPDPTTEELLDYYSDHLDRYHTEPTASFEQVFFVAPPQDAAALLDRLRRKEPVTSDPFMHGLAFDRYGRSMLRGIFGQPFVESVWDATQGEWTGPLQTPLGWHYVRVSTLAAPALRAFPEVRDQVENDWIATQIQAAVDRKVAELARGQSITIER